MDNRQIAKMAARGVLLYHAQILLVEDLDARLLAEAKCVDRYDCSEEMMLSLCQAEYRKLKGSVRGGHMSGITRKLGVRKEAK